MAKWELIAEVKDAGYYIGWRRRHPEIHMPEPMQPMSKSSLVQIGGREGSYEVRGLTYAHSVFAEPMASGLKLFDETHRFTSLEDAQNEAEELKKRIASLFDHVTRSDVKGKFVGRGEYLKDIKRVVKRRTRTKSRKQAVYPSLRSLR